MKNFKFYTLCMIATLGLFVASCDDDDDHSDDNVITITIEEPIDGAVITDCADVHIHVDFVATDENHEMEIILHPEGDVSNKIIDIDMHEHDKEVTIEQEVDLCSFPAGTCFHLEIEACIDHDCAEKEVAEAEFCLE